MKSTTLAATAALLAGLAFAAQAGERHDATRAAPHPDAITKADFVLRSVERFDAMDANHDGVLTREEARESFRMRMREDMREGRRERREDDKTVRRERHDPRD